MKLLWNDKKMHESGPFPCLLAHFRFELVELDLGPFVDRATGKSALLQNTVRRKTPDSFIGQRLNYSKVNCQDCLKEGYQQRLLCLVFWPKEIVLPWVSCTVDSGTICAVLWMATDLPVLSFPELGAAVRQPRPHVLHQVRDGVTAPVARTTRGLHLLYVHLLHGTRADFFRPYCQIGRVARQLMDQFGRCALLMCRAVKSRGSGYSKLRKPGQESSLQLLCSRTRRDVVHYLSAVARSISALKRRFCCYSGDVWERFSEIILDVDNRLRNLVCNVLDRIMALVSPDRYYHRYRRVWLHAFQSRGENGTDSACRCDVPEKPLP